MLSADPFSLSEPVFSFQCGLWESVAGITEIKNLGLQISKGGVVSAGKQ